MLFVTEKSTVISYWNMLPKSNTDRKLDIVQDEGKDISRDVSRRDMATQMSPERSPHSSPNERNSFASSTNSMLPTVEWQNSLSSKQEVRDVQVDERVTMTRWCKKNKSRTTGKGSGNCDDWKRKALEIRSTNWEVSETANSISKYVFVIPYILVFDQKYPRNTSKIILAVCPLKKIIFRSPKGI